MRYTIILLLSFCIIAPAYCMEEEEQKSSVILKIDGIVVPINHLVEIHTDEDQDITLHLDLQKLFTLAYEIQKQKESNRKAKKRKEWGTQQDLQEFLYGKEKTKIPLKDYQEKHQEYWHAFNSWRELYSEAYETYNKSNKSTDALAQFAATLEKAWEHKQKVLALKQYATNRNT